ncbi:hypothetical protein AK812_SmicGene32013 [Symbiodinium microadriaticum]|uniref:Uncharacterized protein n=1 Tax=Symbiodinium microadriaticum TaxID=2951 RepID=A0A1Q9CV80_SYMMI|nr:hypothetical protein AK812_SmicGene32013 [Symbiodinium microadriaticum]
MATVKGNLLFKPTNEALTEVHSLLDKIRLGEWLPNGADGTGREAAELLPLIIYSDFEVDDLMAIAQLWEWKLERLKLKGSRARPVIIFGADFAHKDGCTVFEKKLLMARLMLGLEPGRDFQILCSQNSTYYDKTVHPLAEALWDRREASLAVPAEEISRLSHRGDAKPKGEEPEEAELDLYIIAPGRGHLGDLFSVVETRYPDAFERLCKRAHVVMYTGSFNTTGMEPRDLDYVCQIAQSRPLIDISKFVFFGKAEADPVTASADSFASPTLAERLSEAEPLLAAAIFVFAEEFQGNLIRPDKWSLFRGNTLTEEEQSRFREIVPLANDPRGLQKYAESLMRDEGIFEKIASYKQSTVKAFALGTCDAPLCDEVCFLFEWCLANSPEALMEAAGEGGEWWIDPDNGFSGVVTKDRPAPEKARCLDARALQPSMKDPKDQVILQAMRNVLEEYVLRHLASCRRKES